MLEKARRLRKLKSDVEFEISNLKFENDAGGS